MRVGWAPYMYTRATLPLQIRPGYREHFIRRLTAWLDLCSRPPPPSVRPSPGPGSHSAPDPSRRTPRPLPPRGRPQPLAMPQPVRTILLALFGRMQPRCPAINRADHLGLPVAELLDQLADRGVGVLQPGLARLVCAHVRLGTVVKSAYRAGGAGRKTRLTGGGGTRAHWVRVEW